MFTVKLGAKSSQMVLDFLREGRLSTEGALAGPGDSQCHTCQKESVPCDKNSFILISCTIGWWVCDLQLSCCTWLGNSHIVVCSGS